MENKIIVSVPKKQQSIQENSEKRVFNQFVFGEIGIGPKVYKYTNDFIYFSEKSPFPVVAKTGGDIKEKMDSVDQYLFDLGIMYDNTNLNNLTYDNYSKKFQIIDAGGSRIPSKITSKYVNEYRNIKSNISKSDLNDIIKKNNIKFSKIGEGDSRDVYEIESRILQLI